jgi:hypothetical protein
MREAAQIAFATIAEALSGLTSVAHIRFVLYSQRDHDIHQEVMRDVLRDAG